MPAVAGRHWLFGLLLAGGLLLRAGAMLAARPALLLDGDSFSYLQNAAHLHPEAFHPIGYAVLLRVLSVTRTLVTVVAVQHLLGLLLAGAVYAVLLRLGVRPWLAALGAAPLLLDGYQVDIEQAVMAETLFEVLVTAGLLLLAARRRTSLPAYLIAGLLVAAATITRGLAAAAALPAIVVLLLVRRPGWARAGAVLGALAGPVLLYGAWYAQGHGTFGLEGFTGRLLYGRVEPLAYDRCAQLRLPAAERELCDPHLGADPAGVFAVNAGNNFYTWSPHSPYARLARRHGRTAEALAQSYAETVIVSDPLRYLGSVAADTADYFAPDRTQVATGQWPVQAWQFRARTDPRQFHVLLGRDGFGQERAYLPPPQPEHWPARLLAGYQTFGFTPGPVLLAALVLTGLAVLRRPTAARPRSQRDAAVLFGLCGLLLIVVAAAVAGQEPRYLLPTLPLIPPAGVLAVESLASRGGRWGRRASRPGAAAGRPPALAGPVAGAGSPAP